MNTPGSALGSTPHLRTRKRWEEGGLEIAEGTPEQFGTTLRIDYERYGKLIVKIGSNIAQRGR